MLRVEGIRLTVTEYIVVRGGKLKKFLMVISILVVIILLFSYFSNRKTIHRDYIFTGESEHWKGEFVYKETEKWIEKNNRTSYSNESKYTLAIQYKGSLSELASVEKLSYSYKTSTGGGSDSREFDEPTKDVIFTSSGSGVGNAMIYQDEVIEVTMKWDTFEESFELRNNGK